MVRQPDELFEERTARIADAVALREPDRVPFAPFATFFPARYSGISFHDAMHDYAKLSEAVTRFMTDFQFDAFTDAFRILGWAPTLEILDYRQLVWPGHGGKAGCHLPVR